MKSSGLFATASGAWSGKRRCGPSACKVRDLLAQAILAQVRKLATEERFDFMSETDAQKLKLFVKLSDDHAVVLHIPFKEFKQFLPQLRRRS